MSFGRLRGRTIEGGDGETSSAIAAQTASLDFSESRTFPRAPSATHARHAPLYTDHRCSERTNSDEAFWAPSLLPGLGVRLQTSYIN